MRVMSLAEALGEVSGNKPDDSPEREAVERRQWCLTMSCNLALHLMTHARNAPPLDVILTAEEMNEFLETGVARKGGVVSREKQ
jgi:hypothetical protein